MHIKADTLDDLLHEVFRKLLKSKVRTRSSKGPAREIMAALLTIKNPTARFSRTENRATLFSCLGETLWYLSGSNRLNVIEYYIPHYREFLGLPHDAVVTTGAYGPRLRSPTGVKQIEMVIDMLKRKRDTRQAVVQIFDSADLQNSTGDVPCTCTLQFLARGGSLHMLTTMRSNDAYLGLPHDVFAFTMIQELVARSISQEVGVYNHAVGSLHLYDAKERHAKEYLDEGWQEKMTMPSMPAGDPWSSIEWLLETEALIRLGQGESVNLDDADPYWADLARLLKIKALFDANDKRGIVRQKNAMSCKVYDAFIRGKAERALVDRNASQLIFPEIEATGRRQEGSNS